MTSWWIWVCCFNGLFRYVCCVWLDWLEVMVGGNCCVSCKRFCCERWWSFYADSTSRTNFLYVFKIFMILCPFMDTLTKMSGYLYVSVPIEDYLEMITMFVVSRLTGPRFSSENLLAPIFCWRLTQDQYDKRTGSFFSGPMWKLVKLTCGPPLL